MHEQINNTIKKIRNKQFSFGRQDLKNTANPKDKKSKLHVKLIYVGYWAA